MKKKGMTIRGMENAVCVCVCERERERERGVFIIQGVSKRLGQTSGLSVPHRNKTNSSHKYRKAATCFRGIAQQHLELRHPCCVCNIKVQCKEVKNTTS